MKATVRRSNSRNAALLDAAAQLFASNGFRKTTMRDIAKAVGMLPGSIYYHYPSKDDLLLAVYEAGVAAFIARLEADLSGEEDPWERLRVGMASHIDAITRSNYYTRVINRVVPEQVPKHTKALIQLRDQYESCFRDLVDDLPLAPWVDRSLLRLMILGAGNHAQLWFKPNGGHEADEIGREFARFLAESVAAETCPSDRVHGTISTEIQFDTS